MTTPPTTCIIGDIHGCITPLLELLEYVEDRADSIIFLGDYIDRGADSKKVVDEILELQRRHRQVITLMGNHEFMLRNYLLGYDEGMFLQVGGEETLASYGIDPYAGYAQAGLSIPEDHHAFFNGLQLYREDRYGIYVHAGLQPGVHISRQSREACLWIRDEFIRSSYRFDKPVVFGHTVFKKPFIKKNKIGIDTGAVYGNRLTALLLPEKEFISVPGEQEHPYPRYR
ncbi:MAG: metallophosphoesterase [Desulfobulbaceae bacterium]|nr:metallophosphoesterase [Desulfobulbaceae bacterium]